MAKSKKRRSLKNQNKNQNQNQNNKKSKAAAAAAPNTNIVNPLNPFAPPMNSSSSIKLPIIEGKGWFYDAWNRIMAFLNNTVGALNTSKVFAGIMIITLNIASKFITFKFSQSMESFLKYTFSRNILVFAICYVGSRDIFVSLILTLFFMLLMDVLLNEDSRFCILPQSFREYHTTLMENMQTQQNHKQHNKPPPTEQDVQNAIEVLSQFKTGG
jgi:uncharacterized membrane protein